MLGDELLDVIHRYPDHVWVFLHEFPALTGEQRRRSSASGAASTSTTVEAVLAGRRRVGRVPRPRAEAHRPAWLGMHNYTYLWLKAGGSLTAAQVADWFGDIFIRGIAAT